MSARPRVALLHDVPAGVRTELENDFELVREVAGTDGIVPTPVDPVDEEALADALEAGAIAGAALDVFEHEPEVNPRLLARDDVVLAPHLGSATHETREAMGMLVVEALRAVLLEDRAPANEVSA